MEQNCDKYPESSVSNIIEKIRRRLGYYGDRDEFNRSIFQIIDGSGDCCSYNVLVNGLEGKGMNLTTQEGTTLFRALRVGDSKDINRESA